MVWTGVEGQSVTMTVLLPTAPIGLPLVCYVSVPVTMIFLIHRCRAALLGYIDYVV